MRRVRLHQTTGEGRRCRSIEWVDNGHDADVALYGRDEDGRKQQRHHQEGREGATLPLLLPFRSPHAKSAVFMGKYKCIETRFCTSKETGAECAPSFLLLTAH